MSRKDDSKRRKKLERDRKLQEYKRSRERATPSTPDHAATENIMISNNGRLIESTNYWSSSYAVNGVAYFSVNAGCIRLLLPDTSPPFLDDGVLDGTQYVILSRGTMGGKEGYEVLFEDGSSSPFVIHTLVNQWDRLISVADSGRTGIGFDVYKDGKRIEELTARFRVVSSPSVLEALGIDEKVWWLRVVPQPVTPVSGHRI